ncbi:MAG TPA: ribosome biogenesis GTP-binding protein YihA/YsxC [Alphaproteobacteria bacterium]|nr:ribosome biogenesis GTP-binding protein YihA/YsxC [Alphaproteobacteria bacterium]
MTGFLGVTFDAEQLEAGRILFAQDCRFMLSAAELAQVPEAGLPEVAFIGRSNVGKSSLVNALTGRSTLAKVSNTPGRTQQLNFFELGEALRLVDLPGYGYAEAPKSNIAAWTKLVNGYLRGRVPLRRVCLLVDSRHGVKANDREMMEMLDTAGVAYQVVLTKADKIKPAEQGRAVTDAEAAIRKHAAAFPLVLLTSSEKGAGIPELRAMLAGVAAAG